MQQVFSPIKQEERIEIVDVLRAIALLGVVVMNYLFFFNLGNERNLHLPAVVSFTLQTFTGITWMSLSFIFGYGFAASMNKPIEIAGSAAVFHTRKMLWLLVIGVINSAIFFGDILKDYAVIGMVLLLFRFVSARTLLLFCLGIFVVIPYVNSYVFSISTAEPSLSIADVLPLYKNTNLFNVFKFGLLLTWLRQLLSLSYVITIHVVVLCCFVAGVYVFKMKFFTQLITNSRLLKNLLLMSGIGCLVFSNIIYFTRGLTHPYFAFHFANYRFLLCSVVFFIVAICWLYQYKKYRSMLSTLRFTGRMTLTHYLLQNIFGLFLFSGFGFGLVNRLPKQAYVILALMLYMLQIFVSKWWLSRYYFGPAEWVWRCLAYGRRLPFKKSGVLSGPL